MLLDKDLLRSIRQRWRFKERVPTLPLYIFEEQTRFLVSMMSRYFKQFKDCEVIDKEAFITWLTTIKDGTLNPADIELIDRLLIDFERPLTEQAEQFLTERITDTDAAYRTAEALEKFHNGDEIEFGDVLRGIVELHNRTRRVDAGIMEVTQSVEEIMDSSNHTAGLQWFLPGLNRTMRPAQPGDQILVAARPDSGKTSFLAGLAAHWSGQLRELEPDDDRPILWLNNEGPGSRIKLRLYQTVLQATLSELSEFRANGTLESCYLKAIREDRIRIFDIHGKNTADLERLFEKHRPAVVIYDMLDHVRYTGIDVTRNSRTDEYLEGLYMWGREQGVINQFVSVISTQLSGDAENMQYPALGMLKDSKTGKQGTADVIITLGMMQHQPSTRFIGLTKNKLNLGGKGTGNRVGEVTFDGARGKFKEPTPEGGDET